MATIDASTAIDDTVAETLHRQWLDRSASKALAALQYVWYLTITLALMVLNMVVPRRFSLVETTPFIDATQFEWHEWVIGEMGKVQAELEDLLAAPERIPNHQDIIETIAAISNDDKWLSYFFYIYGQRFDKQCELSRHSSAAGEHTGHGNRVLLHSVAREEDPAAPRSLPGRHTLSLAAPGAPAR